MFGGNEEGRNVTLVDRWA